MTFDASALPVVAIINRVRMNSVMRISSCLVNGTRQGNCTFMKSQNVSTPVRFKGNVTSSNMINVIVIVDDSTPIVLGVSNLTVLKIVCVMSILTINLIRAYPFMSVRDRHKLAFPMCVLHATITANKIMPSGIHATVRLFRLEARRNYINANAPWPSFAVGSIAARLRLCPVIISTSCIPRHEKGSHGRQGKGVLRRILQVAIRMFRHATRALTRRTRISARVHIMTHLPERLIVNSNDSYATQIARMLANVTRRTRVTMVIQERHAIGAVENACARITRREVFTRGALTRSIPHSYR